VKGKKKEGSGRKREKERGEGGKVDGRRRRGSGWDIGGLLENGKSLLAQLPALISPFSCVFLLLFHLLYILLLPSLSLSFSQLGYKGCPVGFLFVLERFNSVSGYFVREIKIQNRRKDKKVRDKSDVNLKKIINSIPYPDIHLKYCQSLNTTRHPLFQFLSFLFFLFHKTRNM
jgi:hypothetical protein